eukprot:CAMPEP_0116891918 /NCGR_PEP_ID=MMETSP0467-20121206/2240_1 /TAXON_ID=283647 /ORGANISM="Mesodinium pulex, Strain SPMC105" /LENGTH=154 /DNA_ID=CAMNT_0004560725 /DNA_START=523 /DNA_END=990 /DNA_ORIENTATION=-
MVSENVSLVVEFRLIGRLAKLIHYLLQFRQTLEVLRKFAALFGDVIQTDHLGTRRVFCLRVFGLIRVAIRYIIVLVPVIVPFAETHLQSQEVVALDVFEHALEFELNEVETVGHVFRHVLLRSVYFSAHVGVSRPVLPAPVRLFLEQGLVWIGV